MIAWCGSCAEGLGWLRSRCSSIDTITFAESMSVEKINELAEQHPQRMILAVENRIQYPLHEIQHLQRTWPEIPFAVAYGNWFDGARRTGIGAREHLGFPWYRWLDGWQSWLCSSNSALLPAGHSLRDRSGVIVCNCHQTGVGWQTQLNGSSSSSSVMNLKEFLNWLSKENAAELYWILWDDTCLDTFTGTSCEEAAAKLFESIRDRFKNVLILAATSMPRWPTWHQWMSAGASELIAKPSPRALLSNRV